MAGWRRGRFWIFWSAAVSFGKGILGGGSTFGKSSELRWLSYGGGRLSFCHLEV